MAADNEVAKNGRSRREVHHFTQKSLEALLPRDKPYIVRDDETPGLIVKVYPTGRKTFFLNVKVGLTSEMFKLGIWPDLNVAMVREKVKKMRADLAMGKNPKTQKKEGVTLGEFFEIYMERHGNEKKSSAKDRSCFERLLKPWHNYKLPEITRSKWERSLADDFLADPCCSM